MSEYQPATPLTLFAIAWLMHEDCAIVDLQSAIGIRNIQFINEYEKKVEKVGIEQGHKNCPDS